jgi:hypothetical protein
VSGAAVAKKKTKPEAPPPEPDPRQIVISIKGSADFRDWLNRLADHERVTSVAVIERALVEYAANHGFAEPAPKRTGPR